MEHARGLLPSPTQSVATEYERLLSDYISYLEHNELELALDMLQELGEIVPCRAHYWEGLKKAAETMELQERISYFRQRFEQAGKETE